MSDDEDYFDDDEYLYVEDDPVAEAVSVDFIFLHVIIRYTWLCSLPSNLFPDLCAQDDLAEHTMHSPVWQEYDPSYDLTDVWSDWEYYSDDYYDEEPARKKQILASIGDGAAHAGGKRKATSNNGGRWKRRRLEPTADIPGMSLDEFTGSNVGRTTLAAPIVLWRSKERPQEEPVFQQGNGEIVALLKDWREIFGSNAYEGELGPYIKSNKQIQGQGIKTQLLAEDHEVKRTELGQVGKSIVSSVIGREMLLSNKLGSRKDRLHVTSGSSVGHSIPAFSPKTLSISASKEAVLAPSSGAASVGESRVSAAKSKNASGAKRKGSEAELDCIEHESQRNAPSRQARNDLSIATILPAKTTRGS